MFNFNQKLRERIKDLEREAAYKEREYINQRATLETNLKYEALKESVDLKIRNAEHSTANAQLLMRLDKMPYSQLTDILKALVVKLPTMNIQGITVTPKEK